MNDEELSKAYRALTQDEREAFYDASRSVLSTMRVYDANSVFLAGYILGRQSLLDAPRTFAELYGGKRLENKIVVKPCPQCAGVDSPPRKA